MWDGEPFPIPTVYNQNDLRVTVLQLKKYNNEIKTELVCEVDIFKQYIIYYRFHCLFCSTTKAYGNLI